MNMYNPLDIELGPVGFNDIGLEHAILLRELASRERDEASPGLWNTFLDVLLSAPYEYRRLVLRPTGVTPMYWS